MRGAAAVGCAALVIAAVGASAAALAQTVSPSLERYRVSGDAIELPLTREPGDAARGRKIVLNQNEGGCLLCHAVREPDQPFMGNLAPALSGVGARLSAGQLRLRVVDPARVKPEIAMPSYYRVEELSQVATAYRGKPILSAQQVEDVVAYLLTLKEPLK